MQNLFVKDSKYATGRRKRSIARVWVKKGSGKIYVNGKEMNKYFKRPVHQISVARPLHEINASNEYDVKWKRWWPIWTSGCTIYGLARALVNVDASLKKLLKKTSLPLEIPGKLKEKNMGTESPKKFPIF